MRHLLLPLGFALAGSLVSPLSATAIPIRAVNGVAQTVPSSTAGPRHPGVISLTESSAGQVSALKPSGRPVPAQGSRSVPQDQAL